MRLIGLLIALGIIGWVLYKAAGGDGGDGAVPEGYQQSLDKAEAVEQTLQDTAEQRLRELEQVSE